MAKPRDNRQKDLLRPALEAIIDLGHPLVRLAREIDWGFLDSRFASVCTPGVGQPPLPTRLVAGLFILKHMHLSDEVLCARWVENPYYQFFCGELSFCHRLPFERSSLTHWRQRLGEEQLAALIQESLSVAHKTGALATRDLERVVVDTTVQPKAIAHPTDARLCHRAIEKLVDLARRNDVPLRQSYRRVAKRAAIMGWPLRPCPPVQARPARIEVPAHPARPGDPRYPPQDRREPSVLHGRLNMRSSKNGHRRSVGWSAGLKPHSLRFSGCDSPDPKIRSGLLKEARHSFWLLVVQREASGFNNSAQIIRDYAVPDEVHAQLGLPLTAYPMRRRRSFQAKTSQRATYRNEFRPSGSGDMA
jgi:hypothetical protein